MLRVLSSPLPIASQTLPKSLSRRNHRRAFPWWLPPLESRCRPPYGLCGAIDCHSWRVLRWPSWNCSWLWRHGASLISFVHSLVWIAPGAQLTNSFFRFGLGIWHGCYQGYDWPFCVDLAYSDISFVIPGRLPPFMGLSASVAAERVVSFLAFWLCAFSSRLVWSPSRRLDLTLIPICFSLEPYA